MARRAPNPQEILDQLRRLIPTHAVDRAKPEPTSTERILDAALAAFSQDGVRSVTMSRIARDAGVSREWLYRKFNNREGLIIAVAQREVSRFIDGLALRAPPTVGLDDAMVDTFVYAVEYLRDHELLQRVLQDEPDVITGRLLSDGRPVMTLAVTAAASYLSALSDLDDTSAMIIADALVRIITVIVFIPVGPLDLHDPDELRRYARTVVPSVIAGARSATAQPADVVK